MPKSETSNKAGNHTYVYSMHHQGVVTLIIPVNHPRPGSKRNQAIKRLFWIKSSDQEMFQIADQATLSSTLKAHQKLYGFLDKISSNQGHILRTIKAKFHQSKFLIPVTDGSTSVMRVIIHARTYTVIS